MDTKTNIVSCNVCGHKMAIPPGFEGQACRCSKCGTPLQIGGGDDMLSLKLDFDLDSSPPPKPVEHKAKATGPTMKSTIIGALVTGLIGIVAGVIVLGFAMASIALSVADRTENKGDTFRIGFKGGADFGVLVGFLLGTIVYVTYTREPSYLRGAAIGSIMGMIITVTHYVFETVFIAQPDTPIYINAIVGVFGGSAAAALTLWFKDYFEVE